MKNKYVLAAISLIFCANAAFAGASPNLPANPDPGNGIITPNVADGVLMTTAHTYFADTGKLAVCFEKWGRCEGKQWRTVEQAIHERFPKATYVGFKLVQTRDGSRADLYFQTGQ